MLIWLGNPAKDLLTRHGRNRTVAIKRCPIFSVYFNSTSESETGEPWTRIGNRAKKYRNDVNGLLCPLRQEDEAGNKHELFAQSSSQDVRPVDGGLRKTTVHTASTNHLATSPEDGNSPWRWITLASHPHAALLQPGACVCVSGWECKCVSVHVWAREELTKKTASERNEPLVSLSFFSSLMFVGDHLKVTVVLKLQ